MTQRFSPLAREALAPEQQRVYDAILAGPRGAVPAPFHIFLQSAPLADRVQQLGGLLRYGTGLPPRLSELAILVTAAHWAAEYEWSVHEGEARKAGVPEAAIRAIAAGTRPVLEGDDALVYDFASTFYANRDVPDELFAAAKARFGDRTTVELASILGYYSMLAIVLNVFRVKASGELIPMMLEVPTCNDQPIWDVWLSLLWLPAVTVADELEIFDSLAREPATPAELAQRHGFDLRGAEILLSLLTSLRFCVSHLGRYQVTEPTQNYLLRKSPFYWGGVFIQQRTSNPIHAAIRGAVVKKGHRIVGQSADEPPVEMWESGEMTLEAARGIAAFMHSHSLAAATGMALRVNLSGVKSLLDVGGGSGCFCITLAKQNPQLRCTVMDLQPMCEVALEYINAGGVVDRVGVKPVNMFQEDWPRGHDAMLFSNIFHDWGPETNAKLAANAFAALPRGGRILLHEMLLDDSGDGPLTTAAFSTLMLANTRGRQFTFQQVKSMLEEAGFTDIDLVPTYSYYSVVSGTKR